ncbi:hypothetical protein FIBSPDRAFT_898122 [Athelia psychrophila]|uniref:Uncharacterized protein n=1 Tax=Athelia psychrophila TaxID=1759441 RepID=A0A166BBT9_9AGAM|nr:hypothetical protein FIBSPDRAFT_898122 [Fibularhizoctonia sp. CBS 109695]
MRSKQIARDVIQKQSPFESYLDQHYDGVTAKVFLDAYRHYDDVPCSNDRDANGHYDGVPCSNDRHANRHYDGLPCPNDRDVNQHYNGPHAQMTATQTGMTTASHAKGPQRNQHGTRHGLQPHKSDDAHDGSGQLLTEVLRDTSQAAPQKSDDTHDGSIQLLTEAPHKTNEHGTPDANVPPLATPVPPQHVSAPKEGPSSRVKEGGDNKEEDEAFHLKMSLRAVALRTGDVWRCLVLGTPAVT